MDEIALDFLPVIKDAGATITIILLLVFAERVSKRHHERSVMRDKMFLDVIIGTQQQLIECMRKIESELD